MRNNWKSSQKMSSVRHHVVITSPCQYKQYHKYYYIPHCIQNKIKMTFYAQLSFILHDQILFYGKCSSSYMFDFLSPPPAAYHYMAGVLFHTSGRLPINSYCSAQFCHKQAGRHEASGFLPGSDTLLCLQSRRSREQGPQPQWRRWTCWKLGWWCSGSKPKGHLDWADASDPQSDSCWEAGVEPAGGKFR